MVMIPICDFTDRQRFNYWYKVLKRSTNKCWPWQGGLTKFGHGIFCINGSIYGAHRVMWKLVHGVDPGNLYVLHKCNNPRCCNPYHLYLGTQSDNIKQAHDEGRHTGWCYDRKGNNNSRAKLSSDDIINIRELANCMTHEQIAKNLI